MYLVYIAIQGLNVRKRDIPQTSPNVGWMTMCISEETGTWKSAFWNVRKAQYLPGLSATAIVQHYLWS